MLQAPRPVPLEPASSSFSSIRTPPPAKPLPIIEPSAPNSSFRAPPPKLNPHPVPPSVEPTSPSTSFRPPRPSPLSLAVDLTSSAPNSSFIKSPPPRPTPPAPRDTTTQVRPTPPPKSDAASPPSSLPPPVLTTTNSSSIRPRNALPTPPSQYKVGQQVQAKYSKDGKYFNATIDAVCSEKCLFDYADKLLCPAKSNQHPNHRDQLLFGFFTFLFKVRSSRWFLCRGMLQRVNLIQQLHWITWACCSRFFYTWSRLCSLLVFRIRQRFPHQQASFCYHVLMIQFQHITELTVSSHSDWSGNFWWYSDRCSSASTR